jgi:hypothetical protein
MAWPVAVRHSDRLFSEMLSRLVLRQLDGEAAGYTESRER